MIAALPMYDRPECRTETDRLWAHIRDGLRAGGVPAPEGLTRDCDLWDIWQAPDLVFAQTCGLPYRARLVDRVTLIGAPTHDPVEPGLYRSVIITRPEPHPFRPRLAVNDGLSQSGWANLADWLAANGLTAGPVLLTGAHRNSAEALRDGKADMAAIDAVTWSQMLRFDPWARDLRVIDWTAAVPALPYIAAPGADLAICRSALAGAIAALSKADREVLQLYGFVPLEPEDYTRLPIPVPPSA